MSGCQDVHVGDNGGCSCSSVGERVFGSCDVNKTAIILSAIAVLSDCVAVETTLDRRPMHVDLSGSDPAGVAIVRASTFRWRVEAIRLQQSTSTVWLTRFRIYRPVAVHFLSSSKARPCRLLRCSKSADRRTELRAWPVACDRQGHAGILDIHKHNFAVRRKANARKLRF